MNALLGHRGQTGTFPRGPFPSGVTLNIDFQPWAGQCKEAKVEENRKTGKDATKGGVEGGSGNVFIQLPSGLFFTKVSTPTPWIGLKSLQGILRFLVSY